LNGFETDTEGKGDPDARKRVYKVNTISDLYVVIKMD